MTSVFIVQSEPAQWARLLADRVRALGHRPVLVSGPLSGEQRRVAGAWVEEVVEVGDVGDPEVLAAVVRERSVDGRVVTCADSVMVAVTRAAELLGVACTPASVFADIRNKFAARGILAGAGLPGPRFALLHDAAGAVAVAREVGLPAIVKPVNGAASHLVRCVRTPAELADAYTEMTRRLPGSMGGLYDRPIGGVDPARSLLVESRLRGPEFAVDLVVRDGVVETLGILGKPGLDDSFLEHLLVCPPFDLSAELDAALRRAAADAVTALGLDNTIAHVELIDDADRGPTVVEVNAGRPGGGLVWVIHELTRGVDLFAECLAAVIGAPAPERAAPKITIPVAHCIVFGSGGGRLVKIHGLDDLADTPEVLQAVPAAEPGQILHDDQEVLVVNLLLAGFFSEDELHEAHRDVLARVRLETEPVAADPA